MVPLPLALQFSDPADLVVCLGVLSALFWMVVAWRAMRAHERLADAADRWASGTGAADEAA